MILSVKSFRDLLSYACQFFKYFTILHGFQKGVIQKGVFSTFFEFSFCFRIMCLKMLLRVETTHEKHFFFFFNFGWGTHLYTSFFPSVHPSVLPTGHLLCTISQLLVHMCKMMMSGRFCFLFFHFFKILIFQIVTGVIGQKMVENRTKFCLMTLHISGTIHDMIVIYSAHLQNDYLQAFFFFFFLLIFSKF